MIGILPGIGGSTAGLLAYTAEKSRSKHPEKFGTGIIDGIIASETSNNAVIGGSLVPLLCMGIPGNTVAAVFLGGLAGAWHKPRAVDLRQERSVRVRDILCVDNCECLHADL
ncbi:MAG: tripartite tricarboxylate transporter permease [Synergistaceae bacterium]|nr:tripartite tricarboxylate transporter permease [Synergistaceae bacterium]